MRLHKVTLSYAQLTKARDQIARGDKHCMSFFTDLLERGLTTVERHPNGSVSYRRPV